MRTWGSSRFHGWWWLATGVAVMAGCSTESSTPLEVSSPMFLVSDIPTVEACTSPDVEVGLFKLIKLGGEGTFDVTINGDFAGTVTLTDNECARILLNARAFATPATVTVTETSGTPDYIKKQVAELLVVSGTLQPVAGPWETITGTNTVSGQAWAQKGTVVVFHNSPPPPPPPPPSGTDGCTPGFWKQPHHFGWWTAPYTPNTQFSAVFENAFPGKTLLQVLGQGGGGLNALGRHTVAALLNAASPNVGYDHTVDGVIAAFDDVYPGKKSAYNGLKNVFESANERGCPLGRNEGGGGVVF